MDKPNYRAIDDFTHSLEQSTERRNPCTAEKIANAPLKQQKMRKKKVPNLSSGDWVAINEEEVEWYVGKIKRFDANVGNKKIFIVDNLLIPCTSIKSDKHFKSVENPSGEKKAFQDDIVCNIKPPKSL